MKIFKKSHLSLALTTALAAGALMGTQQASANLDVDAAVATALPAGAPFVSNNQLGQNLVFPYYTTRGEKSSIINLFNTSGNTIAVKVRFHESHNSRDVLDFVVVMSPNDKWAGTVEEGGTGPIFKSRDTTCTVPMIPASGIALQAGAYTGGFADVDPDQTTDRLREGYIEVITMGYASPDNQGFSGTTTGTSGTPIGFFGSEANTAFYSTHVAGVPRDCTKVVANFNAGSGVGPLGMAAPSSGTGAFIPALSPFPLGPQAGGNGSPIAASEFDGMMTGMNPLRGALTIISETNGVGFGTSAVAIGDFQDPATLGANAASSNTGATNPIIGGNATTPNLITAQNLPYFLEPTTASRDGLWTINGLADVELAISAGVVINEWSNNAINGANTDWIIQFPTKAFHVDIPHATLAPNVGCSDSNIQAATNKWRNNGLQGATNALCAPTLAAGGNPAGTGPATIAASLLPFESRFETTGSPVTIALNLVDKEEASSVGGVQFSPQPFSVPTIPWESNIVTFSGVGGVSVLSSTSPELAFDPVTTLPGNGTNGMAMISFPVVSVQAAPNNKLPVVGFVAKQRSQGNATLSFGQIMKHSYQ